MLLEIETQKKFTTMVGGKKIMPKTKMFCSENSLNKVHVNTKWEEGKGATKYFWKIYSSEKMFVDKDRGAEKQTRKKNTQRNPKPQKEVRENIWRP